ncbi:MAG: amidohydrolase family protein, partial [Pseudomonadota bacterium]
FERLHEASARAVSGLPGDTRLGVAPHSLRAVTPESLAALIAAHPSGPVHIHAAEQVREVEEVAAWLGRRPIDWLLSEMGLDPRWCVIHATHMTAAETVGLAQSGAVAGLCPITEANLGDGIFPGPEFLAAQGRFGVGSDSNVRIALGEELRTLEYGQRLSRRSRNCMAPPAEEGAAPRSTGEALYLSACAGGAQALGRPSGALRVGLLADLVALDTKQTVLAALPTDRLLDGLVFAAGDCMVADVWSAGRHLVENGRHAKRQSVAQRFVATMHRLVEDL